MKHFKFYISGNHQEGKKLERKKKTESSQKRELEDKQEPL